MSDIRCMGCMSIKQNSPVCEHCGYDERKPNAPHQLPPGTILNNHYVVGRVLGQGGFGITYMGWDQFLGIPVAIKEFFPDTMVTRNTTVSPAVILRNEQDKDLFNRNRERFAREARSLAKLGAMGEVPNIVRVHNLVLANSTAYIIMEYVKGTDLRSYMDKKGGTLTAEETLHLLLPVMESLEKLHEINIIHRDLSPDNIMVLPNGTTKLIDFGAAHEIRQDERGYQQSTTSILKEGFAPPEQYSRKGHLGPWTDVHAMSATVFCCLTGRVPPSAMERVLFDMEIPWDLAKGLSRTQVEALKKGMVLAYQDRVQNMAQLHRELYVEEPRPQKRCMGCMRIKKNSPVCEHCGYDEGITIPSCFLTPGIRLKNRYLVGKLLGAGAYTQTYIGWDHVRNRTVAIREFFPRAVADRRGIDPRVEILRAEKFPDLFPRNRDSYAREGRTLAKLCAAETVPGIEQILEVVEENNTAYMIVDYVEGTALTDYVRQKGGRLTPEETVRLLKPIMEDLEKLHNNGILHRSMEPYSILVQPDGTAKLIEFGNNFTVRDDETALFNEFSESDIFFPTNAFMAMEQFTRKGNLGSWTDVYAMSTIVYYCLTGKVPPYAPDRLMDDGEIHWDMVPDLGSARLEALKQGMEIRNQDRIQTMAQLREKLCAGKKTKADTSDFLPEGTLLRDRYEVGSVLGRSGFNITYKGWDRKWNSSVAIKEYMPLGTSCRRAGSLEVMAVPGGVGPDFEEFRQSFIEQGQIIYQFRGHPNIVDVRHIFCENNTAYHVMEYLEGIDLQQFLEQQGGRMSWNMLRPIIAQVVSGLKQVHNCGMIHCDISPDNIFLVKSGSVKLLDFGAAQSTLRDTVETSMIVAKRGYSPYEQMRGKDMGPWTDVYALAVTIYRSITGKMIQDSPSRIVNDTTSWPSQMGIAIPSTQWEMALKKGMSLRVEDRFSNMMDFWQALNR